MTVSAIARPPTRAQEAQAAMRLPAPLAAFLEAVDQRMLDALDRRVGRVSLDLAGLLARGGKRIRPRVVYECTVASGRRVADDTVALAAVAELIHTASLCHDDVLDTAALRRGRPSLPARVGNHRAILAGDVLVSAAWALACRHLPATVATRFAVTVHAMALAELRADALAWNPEATVRDCLRVIHGKTAGLFASCAEGAAVLARASCSDTRALFHLGRAFGCAFQIRDDVRDYLPGGGAWGKEPLKDMRLGLVTLPMVLALRCDSDAARSVRAYFRGRGRVALDTASALQLLRETQAAAAAFGLARRLLESRLARVARHARADGLRRLVEELYPPAAPS